ncbi:MAG: formate/nitrite transporter family protein [Eubacteriales bacterium]|nr:formate/nitrite transporter family protein [Eubacteriales bacterium]
MFHEDMMTAAASAQNKLKLLSTSTGRYLLASILAGLYIGLGVLVMSVSGGVLSTAGHPAARFINAFVFPVALTLVVFAGAELFTGNVFVMTAGFLEKKARLSGVLRLLLISYLGNLLGSLFCALLFQSTGLLSGDTLTFVLSTSETKMSLPALQLISRGIFCNMLVCLAVWCFLRMKTEAGKLIVIFWCIFTFVVCGFEHSIANMTLLSLALIAPHTAGISAAGFLYNLVFVTAGNIIGGVLMAACYRYIRF